MTTRIGLVGCASAKLSRPAPARELYTSALFRKASAYAEATCEHWFILSAKHGVVEPDQVLDPYNVKLGRSDRDPAKDSPTVGEWQYLLLTGLERVLTGVEDPLLVLLAGEQYRTPLLWGKGRDRWETEVPMKGLGIGEQLAWLNANTPTCTADTAMENGDRLCSAPHCAVHRCTASVCEC